MNSMLSLNNRVLSLLIVVSDRIVIGYISMGIVYVYRISL
jgi:hypothetical protein